MKKMEAKKYVTCPLDGCKLCKVSGTDAELECKCHRCGALIGVTIVDNGSAITTRVIEPSNKAS